MSAVAALPGYAPPAIARPAPNTLCTKQGMPHVVHQTRNAALVRSLQFPAATLVRLLRLMLAHIRALRKSTPHQIASSSRDGNLTVDRQNLARNHARFVTTGIKRRAGDIVGLDQRARYWRPGRGAGSDRWMLLGSRFAAGGGKEVSIIAVFHWRVRRLAASALFV